MQARAPARAPSCHNEKRFIYFSPSVVREGRLSQFPLQVACREQRCFKKQSLWISFWISFRTLGGTLGPSSAHLEPLAKVAEDDGMTKLGKALRTLFRDDKDTILITEPDPML